MSEIRTKVFVQKAEQLGRGTIICQCCRILVFSLQKVLQHKVLSSSSIADSVQSRSAALNTQELESHLEQLIAHSLPLKVFMYIEVQHANRLNLNERPPFLYKKPLATRLQTAQDDCPATVGHISGKQEAGFGTPAPCVYSHLSLPATRLAAM